MARSKKTAANASPLRDITKTIAARPIASRRLLEGAGITGPRLYAARFPALAAVLLVAVPLPLISSGKFASLFVLTLPQLFSVSMATVWAALAVVATMQLTLRSAGETVRAMTPLRWAVAVGALASPTLIRSILDSSTGRGGWEFAAQVATVIAGGILAAVVIRLGADYLHRPLPLMRKKLDAFAECRSTTAVERALRGAVANASRLLRQAETQTLLRSFLSLVLIVYVVGVVYRPPARLVPALTYLLLVFSVLTAAVSFFAAFADQYGIPVVLVTALVGYGAWYLFEPPHVFNIQPLDAPQALMTPQDVARRGSGPVVLIAAGGGGMRAAVWENAVVERLQRDCPAFLPSVQFVSTVSGGSVGALYLFDSLDDHRSASPERIHQALERASVSSLQELAWTLTYPRLVRQLRLPSGGTDLADALESTWRVRWPWHRATLGYWRKALRDGALPAVSMNASVDITGTPLMIANFEVPEKRWTHPLVQAYQADFNRSDMDIVTAARLSATFPFVTPMASPNSGPHRDYRLADGGYFDNSGLYVQFLWLQDVLDILEQQHRAVVMVEISSTSSERQPPARSRSLAQTFVPPIVTPLTTWLHSQAAADEVRDWLLRQAILEQAKDHHIDFHWAKFTLYNVPASWEMTPSQLQSVTDAVSDPDLMADARTVSSAVCGSGTTKAARGVRQE
jgi:Patatin-like phospholipase